jgi:UDP-3-O-[3-hydroxymyristoyl] glucosamine N-acyltransferase
VRDHVHIGNKAVLGAKAGVSKNVSDGERMIGIPATPEREQKIRQALISKLPEMRQQIKDMAKTIERLTAELECMKTALAACNANLDGPQLDRQRADRQAA